MEFIGRLLELGGAIEPLDMEFIGRLLEVMEFIGIVGGIEGIVPLDIGGAIEGIDIGDGVPGD